MLFGILLAASALVGSEDPDLEEEFVKESETFLDGEIADDEEQDLLFFDEELSAENSLDN